MGARIISHRFSSFRSLGLLLRGFESPARRKTV
nr:MAG TPA: hypothetical protein [Bacteriophage sp.]